VPSSESKRTYVRVNPRLLDVPRRELERVNFATDARPGLPPSLVDAIEADGGLWYAGDYYTDAPSVVARAREVNALALRLDFRDLSLLEELPKVRYLHLLSDGRPPLGPVAGLTKLRALVLGVSAIRGELDLAAFPQLRWLRASLGGKGGEALRESLSRGHPRLEHPSFTEVRDRTLDELVQGFPRLRHLRVHFADHLRTLGDLGPVARTLRGLDLDFTGLRSLDGIEVLRKLEMFRLYGGKVTDLQPLATLRSLRYAELDTGVGVGSLQPLRGHQELRMLALSLIQDEDLSPLGTMPRAGGGWPGPPTGGRASVAGSRGAVSRPSPPPRVRAGRLRLSRRATGGARAARAASRARRAGCSPSRRGCAGSRRRARAALGGRTATRCAASSGRRSRPGR
jgi:hypothetical protein